MAEHIYPKKIGGQIYYYFQQTWREKIDPNDNGKTRGTGKSRVRTKTTYLGTAKSIMRRLKETEGPAKIHHRDFGFVGAIYQTAVEIGLVDILQRHIPGKRFGIPRWLYFMLPIINRLQHATSKEKMGEWAAKTILPDLLRFNSKVLNSKSFWYATDDVISEKELNIRRQQDHELNDDLFVGIDDTIFKTIEQELFANLQERFELTGDVLFYDTTNFFTYIEEPVRAKLARTGHNKDSHHHLRQVGLAMCVEKEWGIPLFHRLYRGNSQDVKTFTGIVDELIKCMRCTFGKIKDMALVLDKGNNSNDNFAALKDKISWVGSLVPTHYQDLIDLPLPQYEGQWRDQLYHRVKQNVMGVDCAVIITYSDKLARKQKHGINNAIAKLKRQITEKWSEYKRRPKKVPAGIIRMLKENRYGKYVAVEYKDQRLVFSQTEELQKRLKRCGKNIIFSNRLEALSNWILTQYHSKEKIEDSFKLLKDPKLIRWRPTRHWTDTKIRAFGFCCVMALVLIRVMERKAAMAGLRMSPAVLREELTDLRQVIMIYNDKKARTQVSERSSVQQKLWDLFNLGIVERHLPIHNLKV